MGFENDFLNYYVPLVKGFCDDLSNEPVNNLAGITQPFFPLFGDQYETATLKIVFVGIETNGGGDTKLFVENCQRSSEEVIRGKLREFRELEFIKWGNNFGYTFFDIILFFLASYHKLPDWKVLKRKMNDSVLRSFAWGNCNAVERYEVTAKKNGVPKDVWAKVKAASNRFDIAKHIIDSLHPDVMVVMWKAMRPESYLAGLDYSQISEEGNVRHFFVKSSKLHIFQIPHPQNMSHMRNFNQGKEYFAQKLSELFERYGLTIKFPDFVQQNQESEKFLEYLLRSAPKGFSKFECVEWIAKELAKRESVMSIPALVKVMNDLEYRTNYGAEFSGGRGSYRLVRGTYDRCKQQDEKEMVAKAFVKPNGEYAYA